ncbi:MAG: SGNH/GDSL hydrolase family protein, partial [Planctomycetaceae bacterium]
MNTSKLFPAVVWMAFFATHLCAAERNVRYPFELIDGDRVVMIGGTFIEREQRDSYIETALTQWYPDRNITFRNLGWSGDTVRAESRGIFDPPEVGYQRLLEQVAELKPTVIMLFYGNNESFAGEEGLAQFEKDYRKLLDDLSAAAANPVFVLVSPHRHVMSEQSLPDPVENNRKLELYSQAIRKLADEYDAIYFDLYAPPATGDWVESDNGIHLTPNGYARAAWRMRKLLILAGNSDDNPRARYSNWHVELSANGTVIEAVNSKIDTVEMLPNGLRFDALDSRLPTLDPERSLSERTFNISGLPKGEYTLSIDETQIGTLLPIVKRNSSPSAIKMITIYSSPEFDQS